VNLLLTDRLACPRCGPGFGLILLADRLEQRRVHQGTLGCPNCRDSFTVRGGFADLRAPPRGPLPEGLAGGDPGLVAEAAAPGGSGDPAEAGVPPEAGAPGPAGSDDAASSERVVALLGIPRGPGTVALIGRPARYARRLVESVTDLDAVVVDPDTAQWAEHPAVSRIAAWPGLPFFSGVLRGVVVDGRLGKGVLFEAARVTAPKCRAVVVEAGDEAGGVLEEAGLSVLAAEAGTVVAARS
jgi:uncharacterized protein YbaR (Trm112 family)